jgi:hypothetical protein
VSATNTAEALLSWRMEGYPVTRNCVGLDLNRSAWSTVIRVKADPRDPQ